MAYDISWYKQVEIADDVLDLVAGEGEGTVQVWYQEGDKHAFDLTPAEAVDLASALLQWATQNRGA